MTFGETNEPISMKGSRARMSAEMSASFRSSGMTRQASFGPPRAWRPSRGAISQIVTWSIRNDAPPSADVRERAAASYTTLRPDLPRALMDLLTERHNGTLELTLNRPAARNALSRSLITALTDTLVSADSESAVRAIILAGAPPAFCAGLDLREVAQP